MKTRTPRKGFTLVELLTVIAIIGILAAILIPTVGNVLDKANRMKAQSNVRQIAQSYQAYALDGQRIRNIQFGTWARSSGGSNTGATYAGDVREWAAVLATYSGLNDAQFYYIDADPIQPPSIPTTILNSDGTLNNTTDFPLDGIAWTVVAEMNRGAPTSTTPLAWTRNWNTGTGVLPNGWDPQNSPWQGAGGHVAFLDAHVVWGRTSDDIPMIAQGTNSGDSTPNIYEAAIGKTTAAAPTATEAGVFNDQQTK